MAQGRTRAAIREETRRRLLDAAAEVFVERGFAGASLESISKRAGYTRGAFHWHFSSKDELLLAVLRDRLAKRIESTDAAVARLSSPSAFNLVQREQSEHIQFAERRAWSLLMLEFWLHVVRRPSLLPEGAKLKDDLRRAITRQIARLLEVGGVEPPVSPELLASALIALEDGFALQELLDPESHPANQLWDVLDFFTEALMRRPEVPRRIIRRSTRPRASLRSNRGG